MLWGYCCVWVGCFLDLAAMLFLLGTVGFLVVRAAMLWVCYSVPVGCLVDLAAMLLVCDCVPVGCLVDLAAILLLLCTVVLFGG
jgi:hypothetical protein